MALFSPLCSFQNVSRVSRWPLYKTIAAAAYLLHVLGDGVLLEELCALPGVEALCVGEELTFKVLLVHGQRGAFGEGVLLVQAQLN